MQQDAEGSATFHTLEVVEFNGGPEILDPFIGLSRNLRTFAALKACWGILFHRLLNRLARVMLKELVIEHFSAFDPQFPNV
jgi:hypothetical protein